MSGLDAGVRVDHQGGDRFRITLREHTLLVDQPRPDGGEDTAPTPTELFVASLVACVAFFARRFLARRGLSAAGLAVDAGFSMASHPSRVAAVTLRLELADPLPPGQEEALLQFVSHCTVHNSLRTPPEVRIGMAELRAPRLTSGDSRAA
jgi:putative redox protein